MMSKSFEAILSWMIDKKLPSFEQLCFHYFGYFRDEEDEYIEHVLNLLHTIDLSLAKKLKGLRFASTYRFKRNHFEILYVEILTKFRNFLQTDFGFPRYCKSPGGLGTNYAMRSNQQFPVKSLNQLVLGNQ